MSIVRILNQSIPIFILIAIFALLVPASSEARTVVRSADTVSIDQDQLIEGDFYTIGNIIHISGQIEEDLLAAGAEVTINGQIGEDVLIAGGNVDVHGTIGDDLRILGGTVIIAEPVLGDVFVVGGTVKILSTASIAGDLTVMGGSVEVSGSVDGRVLGWVETLRLDGLVAGDVEITATALTLGDNANIVGNIQYISQNQLVRSQSATVGGEVLRNDPVIEKGSSSPLSILLPLLVILFSVALWYLLSRRLLQRVVNRALVPGIRSMLVGVLVLLLTPFAISILLVSMLGFFAGVVLLASYVLFFVLAMVAVPAVMAQFVYSIVNDSAASVSLLRLIVGSLLVGVCILVPIVGPILLVGFFVLTFGALADLLIRASR